MLFQILYRAVIVHQELTVHHMVVQARLLALLVLGQLQMQQFALLVQRAMCVLHLIGPLSGVHQDHGHRKTQQVANLARQDFIVPLQTLIQFFRALWALIPWDSRQTVLLALLVSFVLQLQMLVWHAHLEHILLEARQIVFFVLQASGVQSLRMTQ
jgi:hypothetical protein